jgi:hypothetical protein
MKLTVLWRTLLRWNLRTLFWDLEKNSDSPARANLRQLEENFYEESDRCVMAKKFTEGTGRVYGAPWIHSLYALFRGVVDLQSFMSVTSQGAHCYTFSRNLKQTWSHTCLEAHSVCNNHEEKWEGCRYEHKRVSLSHSPTSLHDSR